jgi:hypothetical protein
MLPRPYKHSVIIVLELRRVERELLPIGSQQSVCFSASSYISSSNGIKNYDAYGNIL